MPYQLMLQSWYQKPAHITDEHIGNIFILLFVTIATLRAAKNTLNFSFKHLYFKNGSVNFFLFREWPMKMYVLESAGNCFEPP